MIRISKKADYAILLLTHLTRHANRTRDEIPMSAQELANAVPLGKATIANLLKVLTRHELLESVRGVHGGYRLARPASSISLADILTAVDGPVSIVDCASFEDAEDSTCDLKTCCSSHHPLQVLQTRVVALLEELTLDALGNSCPVPRIIQPETQSKS